MSPLPLLLCTILSSDCHGPLRASAECQGTASRSSANAGRLPGEVRLQENILDHLARQEVAGFSPIAAQLGRAPLLLCCSGISVRREACLCSQQCVHPDRNLANTLIAANTPFVTCVPTCLCLPALSKPPSVQGACIMAENITGEQSNAEGIGSVSLWAAVTCRQWR